jgi:hypothetical protein
MTTQKRTGLSKRVRFEIFKRDSWRCIYCGATPNDGPLHVDHVKPVAAGGTNDPANLVTACGACNLGKSSVPLEQRRYSTGKATEADLDHAEQIREWLAVQRDVMAAKEEVYDELLGAWERYCGPAPRDLRARLPKMLERLPAHRLVEAFAVVGDQGPSGGGRVRYLYGILRNWEKAESATQPAPPESVHVRRCQRVVDLEMERSGVLAAGHHGRASGLELLARAFCRAAWGSESDVEGAPGWFGSNEEQPLTIRGLTLAIDDRGAPSVSGVPGFDPLRQAWDELDSAIARVYGPPGEGDDWDALHFVRQTKVELDMWLSLWSGDGGASDYLQERPDLVKRWVLE